VASKFHFVLLIHAHQPVGNFPSVFASAYDKSYLPFLQCLEGHPGVRLGLHLSGPLLEWIEQQRPDYFERLDALVRRGQVELVGGGFYEPILVSIPPRDQQEQIGRMAGYLRKHFGAPPHGAWLAERVWEPQLPSALAQAGVDYTLVDDAHFLAAGFEPGHLYGYYVAEDRGLSVRLLPGLKALRYLIPFGLVEEVIAFLRESAAAHPGGMACMGDDCEKFGVWPETHEHCYAKGWLEKFFAALEANADWLTVITPGEYFAGRRALGRADLPAASYSEMTEWVLPTGARERLHAVQREFASRPDVLAFLRGGAWRGFLTKYSEANLLHKRMLHVSARLEKLPRPRRKARAAALFEATTHLLRAQCNDAYWHGVFGGIYAPHLRTELWRELIRAETAAARAERSKEKMRVDETDFDADGAAEVVLSSAAYHAIIKPSDGGTLAALDFRPAAVTLINSMTRRREEYHARLAQAAAGAAGGAVSIHEQTRVKEPGLEKLLHYDRWARHAFRLMVFDRSRSLTDYARVQLGEDAALAGGQYSASNTEATGVELVCDAPGSISATKRFSLRPVPRGFELTCEIKLKPGAHEQPVAVGLESVINLLAPAEPDRFFEASSGRKPLSWSGVSPGSSISLQDGWQRVRVSLSAPDAREFWVSPIETVSESEEGFERVYQGSQILAVWYPDLKAQESWPAKLAWRIESL